jgi:hypothetical protein
MSSASDKSVERSMTRVITACTLCFSSVCEKMEKGVPVRPIVSWAYA